MTRRRAPAFTLVELLVAVAVIGILMSILVPVARSVRRQAWLTHAHHDLRQLSMTLDVYHEDYKIYPPARSYCASRMARVDDYNPLPDELLIDEYLGELPQDVFNRGHTYKYLAPGFGWGNDAASWHGIWVPKAFPQDQGPADDRKYWFQEGSPVRFAVWSVGPAGAKSFDQSDMLHYPVPPRHWYPAKPDGIIVHLMTEHAATASP